MGYTKPETKRKWREANRDSVNANQRRLYAQNREWRLEQQRQYNEANAEAIRARRKAAYAADPDKYRAKSLRAKHGMTIAEYDDLLESQDGRCAICGTTSPGGRAKMFHIDHDHECCGAHRSCVVCRRGLLCGACNVGVGMLQDSASILRQAAEYLDLTRTRRERILFT